MRICDILNVFRLFCLFKDAFFLDFNMKTLLLLLAKNFPFFVVATGIYLIPSPEKIGFIISPHRIRNAATLAILDKIMHKV